MTSAISIRVAAEDKKQFEEFCTQVGMNVSTAVNMFIKNVVQNRRLPFVVEATQDPFYSPENMERLHRAAADMKAGKNLIHPQLEV